jgi:peroxiredoxin
MRKVGVLILVAVVAIGGSTKPACGQVAAPQAEAKAGDAKAGDVKPEDVVRQAADYLGKLPAFSCKVESVLAVTSNIQNNRNVTKTSLRLERPNRLAMIVEEGVQGITIVSDGKHLTQYMPILKRYVEKEAPADFDGMTDIGVPLPSTMLGVAGDIIGDSGDAIYKKLMTGVLESKYLGEEKVGDEKSGEFLCHHLRFIQEDVDWDIWIDAGHEPLIRKVAPDLTKQLAAAGAQLGDAKIEFTESFADWNVAPKFTDADFKFTPPADAEQVDSMMQRPEEPPHPLLGQPAPAFTTTDLEDQPIDLAKQLGKNVVMLDFWATWCGPCVQAMPQVEEVAKKFKEKGLVFYAVNCGEDAETIKAFLEQAKLDPTVALDAKDEIGPLYKVEGIPQTVLIGKDGTVQVVHVGFGPDLGKLLSKEVEDLLAGKDLAKQALAKWEERQKKRNARKPAASDTPPEAEPASEPFGATKVWTIPADKLGIDSRPAPGAPRQWMGVVFNPADNLIYVTGAGQGAAAIDAAGNVGRKVPLEQGGEIRLANLDDKDSLEFLTFHSWGDSIKASNGAGESLWDYPAGDGIDDVWAADLTGDGVDEIVIGYNGGTGVHLLDQKGKLLWKNTDIGNVWHVTAGDFNNDGRADVVTTSAAGDVHVFDGSGKRVKDIEAGIYASMVRLAPIGGEPVAIVSGSGDTGEQIVAINYDGAKKWELALTRGEDGHVDDLAIAKAKPWAAVAMRDGAVHVVDLETGRMIASLDGQGSMPHVAWLARKDTAPLLVVGTGEALNAFEISPGGVAASAVQPGIGK